LKILGLGVKNAARSFSFVGREGFSKEGMYRKEEVNAQRPTPNGYLPKANGSFLFIVVC